MKKAGISGKKKMSVKLIVFFQVSFTLPHVKTQNENMQASVKLVMTLSILHKSAYQTQAILLYGLC